MSIVYDYEVAPDRDHFVELFERGNALALESLTPEASSVIGAFPFRKWSPFRCTGTIKLINISVLSLPEWFPGAILKRKAVISKRCATQMISEPFEHARKREVKFVLIQAHSRDSWKAGHG